MTGERRRETGQRASASLLKANQPRHRSNYVSPCRPQAIPRRGPVITPGCALPEMIGDPDEGRFVVALFGATVPPNLLRDYADSLRGVDDLRSEFLRLEDVLSAGDRLDGSAAQQA